MCYALVRLVVDLCDEVVVFGVGHRALLRVVAFNERLFVVREYVVELSVEILHVENLSVAVLYVVVGTREGVLGNDRFCRSVAVGRFAVDGDFRHRFCYAVNSALDCGSDGESLFAVPVVCACAEQRCAVDVREARHFFAFAVVHNDVRRCYAGL